MDRITSHILVDDTDGTSVLHEVDYTISPHRDGVVRYTKVPCSERLCTCPEQEVHERRSAEAPK